jgi:predicted DNA-binding transcriptional regulator YafY
MYSPTTRLLTVLALLQSHRQMTGAEIAERLEIDVRTVRRYITTLQDMGIPVEGNAGHMVHITWGAARRCRRSCSQIPRLLL